MNGKIAFEEHWSLLETLEGARGFVGGSSHWETFQQQILDLGDVRLREMDKNGIEFQIVSLNSPAVQAVLDTRKAIDLAKRANDKLAELVAKRPDRFAGFAALPMQDPEAAAAELTRCVKDFGFKGALVNGFSQKDKPDPNIYYDIPAYRGFWGQVSKLDVPFYLHPRAIRDASYDGHPWLTLSPWGFAADTALHSLRLCGSGLFDDYPNLKVIIGHLGEGIPYGLWRIDARMRFSPRGYTGKRPLGEYFLDNFYITTSGDFYQPAFQCALSAVGIDRMLFSVDYPFEDTKDAASWFDALQIAESDKLKIARTNAIKLFKLDLK
ncbi:MAG: amidohydrolase [Betaproteobacteria bacterium]|nr:amidohydrolase [Betaproteobacteria bacterium]